MLALVALAVLFLPVAGGRRVTGTAAAADIPVVGSCLVGVLAAGGQGNIVLDDGEPTTSTSRGTPGDCSAVDAARVIAVRFGIDLPKKMKLSDMFSRTEADCRPAVTALADRVGGAGWVWKRDGRQIGIRSRFNPAAQIVGPTDDDPAGHWIACVAVGLDGMPIASELSGDGIARAFATCFFVSVDAGRIQDQSTEPCTVPHNNEELGSVYLTGGEATADDYQTACREFALTATGMPDPTAGGLLRVEAVDDGGWKGGAGSCRIFVTDPDRFLTGTLLGIGTRPLPWDR